MSLDKAITRVRFAPSPTGSLHIGSVRTALFNLLFVRHQDGVMVLRIEDTDEARSTKESEQGILRDFKWLNFHFDEGVMPDGSEKGAHGPYRQTACADSYEKYLRRLITEHKAYYCFCTKEELESERVRQEAAGLVPKYSGRCRSLSDEEVAARIVGGAKPIVRLKVPAGIKKFKDLIRGEIEFDLDLVGDFVIARSISQALYNFAVVVDDATMQITHVIRGEEHLSNTPKQLLISESLQMSSPEYAHVPVILSATGKGKMSKRDGGTTIAEYRDAGYLPEALINFLALLGWHPAGDQDEIMSFDQLAKLFDIERVQKGGAVFDKEKLNFFNQQYIKKLSVNQLISYLVDGGFAEGWSREQIERAIPLVHERMVTLSDFKDLAGFFIALPEYDKAILVWKKGTAEGAHANLVRIHTLLRDITTWERASLESTIMSFAAEVGKGEVLWPLRVAVTGKEQSPPPIDCIFALGKDEVLRRIELAIKKLENNGD